MQDELHNILIVDPRQSELFSTSNDTYLIKKSAQTVSYSQFDAQTKTLNQLSFNVQVPSKSVIVDRKIFIEMQITVDLIGTRVNNAYFYRNDDTVVNGVITYDPSRVVKSQLNDAPDPLNPVSYKYLNAESMPFCMRSNPLHMATSTNSLYINGLLVSTIPQDYTAAFSMARFYGEDQQKMTPSFGGVERMQLLTSESGSGPLPGQIIGLGGAGVASTYYEPKNDDQVQIRLIANTQNVSGVDGPTVAQFQVSWFEQVNIGPFNQYNVKKDNGGMVGVNQLQFVFNTDNWTKGILLSNPGAYLQDDVNTGPRTYNNIVVSRIDKAVMHCCFITPSPVLGAFKPVLHYNCPLFNNFPSTPFALSRTVPSIQNISNIQFSSIPSHLIIFVSKVITQSLPQAPYTNNNSYSCFPTASSGLARIHNISINFNNQTSLLASASELSLYQMSVRNMANYAWPDFIKRCGSFLVIDMARDIGTDALSAVGTSGAYNFSAQVRCSDASDSLDTAGAFPQYQYRINVLTLEDAILEITPSTTRLSSSFDISSVLQSIATGNIDVNTSIGDGNSIMTGAAWWNNLSDFKGMVRPWAQKISQALPKAEEAYNTSFIKPLLPKSYQKGISKGFTLSNAAMALVNRLIGEGMSGGQIKSVLKGQMDPAEMAALKEYLKSYQGGALEGGKMVAKKRLVKKY